MSLFSLWQLPPRRPTLETTKGELMILDHTVFAVIHATPEQVFALVSDLRRHPALAGSGEVKTLRLTSPEPIGVGTTFEADEDIQFGRKRMQFAARSEIVEYDPPRLISWTSLPPGRPKPRRIQWWFRLEPVENDTRVEHQIQVDMGPIINRLVGPYYGRIRVPYVKAGMAQTLENLAKAIAG